MRTTSRPDPCARTGITLIETLVVIAVLAILFGLVVGPALGRGRRMALRAACAANLRQVHGAWIRYLADNGGRFFPFRENLEGGVLWYWGFETGTGAPEGQRPLDKSRARLAPYLPHGRVEICPALPIHAPYFKRKFEIASYGYGINGYLLADLPGTQRMGVYTLDDVQRPGETIAWGDCIQINTWQAPASPERPLLEEWYVLDSMPPPHTHFRHGRLANITLVDGSLRAFAPHTLDPRCDGLVGYLDEPRSDRWFATRK